MEKIRTERQYQVVILDDGGSSETEDTMIPEGTESEQDAAAQAWALEAAEDWAMDGEWGDGGAMVRVYYTLSDECSEWPRDSVDVEIDADHGALIRVAGGDTECAHEWTSEGEGGCSENPGVWSTGGTSLVISEHCPSCGLRRTRHITGSQRNPGEHDTVEYSLPEAYRAL